MASGRSPRAARVQVVVRHERQNPVRRSQRQRASAVDLAHQVRVAQRLHAERRRTQARAPEEHPHPRVELLLQGLHESRSNRVMARNVEGALPGSQLLGNLLSVRGARSYPTLSGRLWRPPPVQWRTPPRGRGCEAGGVGCEARPEGRPGHGRLGVAHTEMTGFTCRGARRSPSGDAVPAAATDQGASRVAPNRTTLIFVARFVTRRESHEEPARAHHGTRRGHADLPGGPASPRPKGRGGSGALSPGPFRPAHDEGCGSLVPPRII